MAKSALLDVLEKTIGKYVQNLDAESLNVAVWSGKINLNALQLDCDAVNAELSRQAASSPNLSIPFKVLSGEFGSFEVDVPWAHLMSRPVILRASDLQVTVEPFNRGASADFLNALLASEGLRAKQILEHRIKSLLLADEYRKQANQLRDLAVQDLSEQSAENQGFVANLVRRIIENLQFEIKNISVSLKMVDCSAGLQISSLSLATTDEDGKVTFVDRTKKAATDGSFLHKVLRINGFGAYIDEEGALLRLASISENANNSVSAHSYVLNPLSFEAKLRQSDSNVCIDFPKYQLKSQLSSVAISLSKPQLELGRKIFQKIREDTSAHPLFPEYRPLKRVTKESAREWWKYAVRCIGRMNGRRSWMEFFLAFQKRRAYIPMYKRHVHAQSCSWIEELSIYELSDLQNMEQDRTISVDGIMTWRNLADAQVQREKQKFDATKAKKSSGGVFSSLFGSSGKGEATPKDAPPISLSQKELMELEELTTQQIEEPELSADSMVLDLCFALKSVSIQLSSHNMRSLASFEMGTVSTKFHSMKNGSFGAFLALSSLEILDRATTNTLFPSVLKNRAEEEDAFTFELSKAANGDQKLASKLSTFEVVAAPLLFIEIKNFLQLDDSSSYVKKQNPMLAQSISGSIDLFYDARGGKSTGDIPDVEASDDPKSQVVEDFSNVLIEAWKNKTKTQADWSLDLDLSAPILFVPESCNQASATVLLFDFGRARFQYGGALSSPRVERWFLENTRHDDNNAVALFDHGHINVSSLAFTVASVSDCRKMIRQRDSVVDRVSAHDVIQPISFSINFGIERNADSVPRVCCFGAIPSISLKLSCTQFSQIVQVLLSWKETLQKLSENDIDHEEFNDDSSRASSKRSMSRNHTRSAIASKLTAALSREAANLKSRAFIRFFCGLRLSRVSLVVTAEPKYAVEAHLIAVDTSIQSQSDGSSRSNLSMGWFWVLDRCDGSYPRVQRLFAHSPLPVSPAEGEAIDIDIIGKLEEQGFFGETAKPSNDLADIAFVRTSAVLDDGTVQATNLVDAKFSTLHINFNPIAVASIMDLASTFGNAAWTEQSSSLNDSFSILSPRAHNFESTVPVVAPDDSSNASVTTILAEMKGFHLSLRSARDDLPLFNGTMSSVQVRINLQGELDTTAFVSVGDLKLATPSLGRTRPEYNTILGLAENECDSLLNVSFYSGIGATKKVKALQGATKLYEAYADIVLSPMRLVYVQAQILALVEYSTIGILGTLTAKAATSAAQVAIELAAPVALTKLFNIKAKGLEVLVPEAAHSSNFLKACVGSLDVSFTALPDASSKITVTLSSMMIEDTDAEKMLSSPVVMNVLTSIPPDSVESEQERAISVDLDITQAEFLLTKPHFAQILHTLDGNISEGDLFIRESACLLGDYAEQDNLRDNEHDIREPVFGEKVTHGGGEFIEKPRRLNLKVNIAALVLSLFKASEMEPLLRLAAVDSETIFSLMPDEARTLVRVTLKDLVCDDRRLESIGRQYRNLIYQPAAGAGSSGDVFAVTYETRGTSDSSVDLIVGSPRIVFIPDVLSEIIDFVMVEKIQTSKAQENPSPEMIKFDDGVEDVVKVDSRGESEAIEASMVVQPLNPKKSFALVISTAKCSVMLVDLGGDRIIANHAADSTVSGPSSVAETIVLCGTFNSSLKQETACLTNEPLNLAIEVHVNEFESFTAFGLELMSAVQIVDPTEMSLYFSKKQIDVGQTITDVRFAILTPLDITISMCNIALINAILTSVNDSFGDHSDQAGVKGTYLTDEEMQRIRNFARALDVNDSERSLHDDSIAGDESSHSQKDIGVESSPPSTVFDGKQNSTSVKVTTPEIKITVVNDLQGCDEALLRFVIRNCILQGHVQENSMTSIGSRPFDAFECSVYTSILADYFDSYSTTWRTLLLQPWELSLKGSRGPNRRVPSSRPNTVIDIESHPCHLSFSEQFLMSLASANRMWAIYTSATESALNSINAQARAGQRLRKSLAAGAARTFVSSLPYAVENHAGIQFNVQIKGDRNIERNIQSGSIDYFRFEPPSGNGIGGKRLYGQDVSFTKTISLERDGQTILIADLDGLCGKPSKSHHSGELIFTSKVAREGKTVVVHVSSGFDIYNNSSISFLVSISNPDGCTEVVGVCKGQSQAAESTNSKQSAAADMFSKRTRKFGIPVTMLSEFRQSWANNKEATLIIAVSPLLTHEDDEWCLEGELAIHVNEDMLSATQPFRVDIECRPKMKKSSQSEEIAPRDLFPFHLRGLVSIQLVDELHPSIDLVLEPRAVVVNDMPVPIVLKSPMPHIFATTAPSDGADEDDLCFAMEEDNVVEVFTSGPSIALDMKIRDSPVGGTATEWIDGGWIDLPLSAEFRLTEPLRCKFSPLQRSSKSSLAACEFFIVEGSGQKSNLFLAKDVESNDCGIEVSVDSDDGEIGTFYITVGNYAVDHSGDLLIEKADQNRNEKGSRTRKGDRQDERAAPLGAYANKNYVGRLSLLPGPKDLIRLLHLTMEGATGFKRSVPFAVDDLAICNGGFESTPILFEDGTPAGFFAYRQLVKSYQSEIHIVPEFVVFNGSTKYSAVIWQEGGSSIIVDPGKIAPFHPYNRKKTTITLQYPELEGESNSIRVDSHGMHLAILSSSQGMPIGSFAVQTVVGNRDSRWVIKLGEVKFSSLGRKLEEPKHGLLEGDFLRFRVRWSELQITLNEARPIIDGSKAILESAIDNFNIATSPRRGLSRGKTWVEARELRQRGNKVPKKYGEGQGRAICTVLLHRFTVDWQRVFKEEASKLGYELESSQRAQLSLVVHNVRIKDENPDSSYPIVFDSMSQRVSFFDLCIRTRGDFDAEIIKIDLIDIKLAHTHGTSDKIYISTSEDFVWSLLDLANRIVLAAAEFGGVDIEIQFDKEHDGYTVAVKDKAEVSTHQRTATYVPPKSEMIYSIKKTRISPFKLVVSFNRSPQTSRYELQSGVAGANVMNYFSRQLKFKIEKAELKFSRYEVDDVKGPPDRIIQLLQTVYIAKIKTKVLSILTSASFQDWKFLTSRQDGNDEYVEGDYLRATGNIAGSSVNYVLKHAGHGVGGGLSLAANKFGDGIESATGAIGLRPLGAGFNSLVSGVGDGVGDTIAGVGRGAGKVIKGTGQGVGKCVGGVTGGALQMGKAIGKGITTGDGRAMATGIARGAQSMGSGVGEGVESVVTGVSDGVLSVGQGLFSGIKNVGRGIGGAVVGKKTPKKTKPKHGTSGPK